MKLMIDIPEDVYESIMRNEYVCNPRKLCKFIKNGTSVDIPMFEDLPTKQEVFNTLNLFETFLKGVRADKEIGHVWTIKSMLRKLGIKD